MANLISAKMIEREVNAILGGSDVRCRMIYRPKRCCYEVVLWDQGGITRVDIDVTERDLALSFRDFDERILIPALRALRGKNRRGRKSA